MLHKLCMCLSSKWYSGGINQEEERIHVTKQQNHSAQLLTFLNITTAKDIDFKRIKMPWQWKNTQRTAMNCILFFNERVSNV